MEKYKIVVSSERASFELEIKSKVTILSGNRVAGRTAFINMIKAYSELGEKSRITLSCDKICRVLNDEFWESVLERTHDSILFADSGGKFLTSKEFAQKALESDNLFVIATRERLPLLPCSLNETYSFKPACEGAENTPVKYVAYPVISDRAQYIEKHLMRDSDYDNDIIGLITYDKITTSLSIEPVPAKNEKRLRNYPLDFQEALRRGWSSLPERWAWDWVDDRVVPFCHQCISAILKKVGLDSYDEYEPLKYSHGRSGMDGTFWEQTSVDTTVESVFAEREKMSEREALFNSADAVIDNYAIWYDTKSETVTLNIVYLGNTEYNAIMTKVIRHMEVSSSNMPLDMLYRMKFIVERNEKLVMQEWKEKKDEHSVN
ncbi:MAG: hypothetical protein J6A19_10310 [Oscillospiraceae bacterium]|nr:hypothetical protein [Oscillospiraceae bacterium]